MRNVRATFREDAGQIWIAPLETPPVTAVPPDHRIASTGITPSNLEVAGTILVRDDGREAK
jgi:hypothetical protein